MLTLTRRKGERVQIGDEIHLRVLSIGERNVRIQVIAPRHMKVDRGDKPMREVVRQQRKPARRVG